MTVQPVGSRPGGGVQKGSSGSGLADVIDTILDKGLVIDAYVSVSLIGIEILSIDARIVVASVDTYLRFAEATGRLDLTKSRKPGLPEVVQSVTSGGGSQEAPQVEKVEQLEQQTKERNPLEAAGDKLNDLSGAIPRQSRQEG
ncbi:gas vesicle protein [Herbidospora galbida]|uniref:Gas vesicle protein A n=1 Tax=Herbidospora galbida TaxID=2575442 RepID=A0A4U3MIE1_9ACTN|nr:gas vesicle protein GvpJ [Herbidospora galbida]TKK87777.1 gas vesicle protein [Herbidospora galbida]